MELRDLAGKECLPHHCAITVSSSGKAARCAKGCTTKDIEAWAVSLNRGVRCSTSESNGPVRPDLPHSTSSSEERNSPKNGAKNYSPDSGFRSQGLSASDSGGPTASPYSTGASGDKEEGPEGESGPSEHDERGSANGFDQHTNGNGRVNRPRALSLGELAGLVRGVRWRGDEQFSFQCPAHEDRQASASATIKAGKILLKCFAGCSFTDICGALSLEPAQLFARPDQPILGVAKRTRYEVADDSGRVVAVHVREEPGKKIWWELPDGTKGLGGLKGSDLPLYGINRIADDSPYVVVTEGEKAASALIARGYPAVGTVTGASSAPGAAILKSLLRFGEVLLWADNDDQGRSHMERIARELAALGKNGSSVRRVIWPGAPQKGDAADFRGSDDELDRLLQGATENLPAPSLTQPSSVPAVQPATSVYDLDNQPALTAIRVYEADEFFEATEGLENVEWLWDRIAPACGLIGIFGDPEAGKSTFCRSFAMSMAQGVAFMGRGCMETKVMYLDLAEETLSHRRAFKKLGLSRGNLKIVSQPSLIGLPNGMELVENAINEHGTRLVIVDMMADLLKFKDLNDYADAKRALRGVRILSQRTNSLIVLLHHTPKALGPDADVLKAGLGSQAIVGAFDLRMAIRRRDKDLSTLVMSNGKLGGEPLTEELILVRHQDTEWIEMGPVWGRAKAEYYIDRVVAFLRNSPDEHMGATAIAQGLGLGENTGWIRGSLYKAFKAGKVDRVKSGHGYRYGALPEKDYSPSSDAPQDEAFNWEQH